MPELGRAAREAMEVAFMGACRTRHFNLLIVVGIWGVLAQKP